MGKLKYTYEQVKEEFEEKEYELLSTTFNGVCEKLEYICKKHRDKGVQKISFSKLHNCNQGCYYCGLERTISAHTIDLDKDQDRLLCQSKGFEYIDTIREKGKITIVFICNNHRELGEQYMERKNMERNIKGCKYCAGKELPEWYVLKKAEKVNPNIKLLEPYKNLSTVMKCHCVKHDHDVRKSMKEILKGHGCYYCGLEKLSEQNLLSDEQVQDNITAINPHIKLVKYNGNKKSSYFYCDKHNKYFYKYYNNLINSSSGCDECYRENTRERQCVSIDEFKSRLKKVHPELIVMGEYINNSSPIEIYCKEHDYTYFSTPVSLLNRKTCCNKTKITYKEEQVCKLLEEKWFLKLQDKKHLKIA